MTRFGDQPERDKVQLTSDETDSFVDIVAEYGAYVESETEFRTNIEVVKELPAEPAPVAPMGYGTGKVEEARAALARARKSKDTNDILEAHNAWLDLGDEMKQQVERAQRDVKVAALLAFIAGVAVGFGAAALIFLLTGGAA